MFNVVTTLPCSTFIFNSLTISFRHKCAATLPTALNFLPARETWISHPYQH